MFTAMSFHSLLYVNFIGHVSRVQAPTFWMSNNMLLKEKWFWFWNNRYVRINDSVPHDLCYIIGVFFPKINSAFFQSLNRKFIFSLPFIPVLGLFLSTLMNYYTGNRLRVYGRFCVLYFLFLLSYLAPYLMSFSL